MLFISLRDVRVVSKTGADASFLEAGKPRTLPPRLHEAALACGCVPCDEAGTPVGFDPAPHLTDGRVDPEPLPAVEEEEEEDLVPVTDIKEAIDNLIARNRAVDFTAGGRPRINAVRLMVGREVSVEEVEAAWEANGIPTGVSGDDTGT